MHFECNFCRKIFSRIDNLNRHVNKYCKQKDDFKIDTTKQQYIDKIQKLESAIKELQEDRKNKTIINNNTYIKNQTLTNNIKINNLGSEDVSSITEQEMYNIVNKCYSALKVLTKRTYIDIPENRNVYIPSYKDSYILFYNNGNWEYGDLKKVLLDIKNTNIDRINAYYEDHINKYPLPRQSYINKMLDESLKGHVDAKYMKDIKMLLLTNRNILKQAINV